MDEWNTCRLSRLETQIHYNSARVIKLHRIGVLGRTLLILVHHESLIIPHSPQLSQ
jgi:hypothetical protein